MSIKTVLILILAVTDFSVQSQPTNSKLLWSTVSTALAAETWAGSQFQESGICTFKLIGITSGSSTNLDQSVFPIIILPFCALLQQSRTIPTSLRYLTGIFLFHSIVTGAFFNSNLISFLTYPEVEQPPGTPEELARSLDYKIKYINYPGAADDLFFSQTTAPTYLKIKRRMEYFSTKYMIKAMLETVVGRKTALINYHGLALLDIVQNATIHPDFVPLTAARAPIFECLVNIGLRKYSKLTEVVSSNTGILQNTGHFDKWFQQALDLVRKDGLAWLKTVRNSGLNQELAFQVVKLTEESMSCKTKPFGLAHLGLAFFSLISGTIVAILGFISEVLTSAHLRNLWKRTYYSLNPPIIRQKFDAVLRVQQTDIFLR
ncbi:unnamed protein product [Allacma fusca]|uniref:Uncharacterized protein n=1 Tax=Allacma fusca TaxID=39272 RepID=A0A8J2KB42_9HEXA|nr:unnamed protein product [Allacma fusca]